MGADRRRGTGAQLSLSEAKSSFLDLLTSIDRDQILGFLNFIDQNVQQKRGL